MWKSILGTLVLVGITGNSMVEGAGFSVSELSSVSSIQGTGESEWALTRMFGQADTGTLGGSGFSGTLATDSILPRHNFDMQVGGGMITPDGMQGMFGQSATLGVRIVPYITLSQRYDSNVFFAPALPGLNRADYVTSFSPGILFLDNAHVVRTTLQAGATGEYFAINPGLNYIGFNGTLTLTMNELVRRAVPGSTFLVAQSVNYSPLVPGFQNGVDSSAAKSTPADEQPDVTNVFVRSQQAGRVNNSLATTSTVAGSMPLTPSVLFQAIYGYSTFRFGTPAVNNATGTNSAQTINSTSHSIQAGPAWRITSSDTLSLRANYENTDYGGGQGGYKALGVSGGWARRFSQSFNLRLYGGASRVEQDYGSTTGQQPIATQGIGYTGGVAVVYVDGPQTVQLNFSSGISPSFVAAVGAMQTYVAEIIAVRRLNSALSLSGGLTYNHTKSINGNVSLPGTFFQSQSGFAGVVYRFSPGFQASLSYSAGTYHGNYYTSDIQSFGRNAVTLTIGAYWF